MTEENKRPAEVDEGAEFDSESRTWNKGELDDSEERTGAWLTWDTEGRLIEEAEYEAGSYHGQVKRYAEGQPSTVAIYQKGLRQGAYQGIVEKGTYSDARIRIEKGEFTADLASGNWLFFDTKGKTISKVDLGRTQPGDEMLQSIAFENKAASSEEWSATSRELLHDGLITEGVCAMARAVATEQKVDALESLLERSTISLTEEASEKLTAKVLDESSDSISVLGNVILRGADAAAMLRAIAIVLDQKFLSRAALDLINAALLVAPERLEYYFTRALVNISLGNDMAAQEDARRLEQKEAENAAFLDSYIRILFPIFDFWPGREKPETHYEKLPEKIGQSLAAIQSTIQKYATRLTRIREAMQQKVVGRPDWLPPDVSVLMTAGPIELKTWEYEIEDPDDPDEVFVIEIDETIDIKDRQLPDLLRAARYEWNALAWLCWAAGYDRVTIPSQINPPPDFGVAAGMSASRLWRCRDKRITGGTEAEKQSVPGFEFEGIAIDELHPALVQIAEGQYAEMQAMFYWLTNAENKSPWQDNLRSS